MRGHYPTPPYRGHQSRLLVDHTPLNTHAYTLSSPSALLTSLTLVVTRHRPLRTKVFLRCSATPPYASIIPRTCLEKPLTLPYLVSASALYAHAFLPMCR